jgi:hypothetical protein
MAGTDKDVFAYEVKVSHVSANPITVRIAADTADLKRLARQWGVPKVLKFEAELSLGRWKRDGVRVKGHVSSEIVQDCVVTLDPVQQQIEEDVEAVFLPENSRLAQRAVDGNGEMFLDPDGPDLPETFQRRFDRCRRRGCRVRGALDRRVSAKAGPGLCGPDRNRSVSGQKTVTFCGFARSQARRFRFLTSCATTKLLYAERKRVFSADKSGLESRGQRTGRDQDCG